MTCGDVRVRLLDYQQGRLALAAESEVRAHLDHCVDCAHADAAEQELTRLLERRLPQHPASIALKRRLAAQWPPRERAPRRPWPWRAALVPALATAAMLLVAAPVVYYERSASRVAGVNASMVTEAVNDHLRLLASPRPLDIESGGIHQVKPWFQGRLDFAPVVSFEGDADFPLKGGAVGYFLDRKAGMFVYARRLHPISLLVFPAAGLPWPVPEGRARTSTERGFTVVMWRGDELGYALVSDVDPRDLSALAVKLGATP
jgi:anti-sigma factor RsiW